MRRSTAPTLKDVAREAGVSTVAVSVVLNGAVSGTRVSEATRQRIVDAARLLHYRPNAIAQGLSRQRMDTIGIVAMIDRGEVNQYFLEMLNSVFDSAAEARQTLTVFSLRPEDDLVAQAPAYCEGRVDGLIFLGSARVDAAAAEAFVTRGMPFVVLHNICDLPGVWNLDVRSEIGARTIVEHLIALGHRRILHLPGEAHINHARQRLSGYREALEAAGIPFDPLLVVPGTYGACSGRERMRQVLCEGRFDPLPTAVFCANDATASGCMEAIGEAGLRIPEDISVVGFDDTLTARLTNPLLTTVRQPFAALARRAVTLLMEQVEAKMAPKTDITVEPALPGTEYFDIELAIRGSAGPPPLSPLTPPYRR